MNPHRSVGRSLPSQAAPRDRSPHPSAPSCKPSSCHYKSYRDVGRRRPLPCVSSPPLPLPRMSDTPGSDTTTLDGANRVNVQQAEADFTQLRHGLSSPNSEDHAIRTQSPTLQFEQLEKAPGEVEAEEPFDLREYLTSSNDASQAAGIKHKHVGVTWDDLEVVGIGGEDNKAILPIYPGVFPFLTPFFRFMSPHSWVRSWGPSCSPSS